MRPRWCLIPALAVSVALLQLSGATTSFATQVVFKSPEQLGAESALVVRGTVSDTRSYWNDTRTKIFTEVLVAVDQTYKGSAPGSLRLLQLGGTVDGVRMTVHGALLWRNEEEVLLFLEPYTPGSYHVSGFSQGKYAVERDARSGRAYVQQAPAGDMQLVGAPAAQSVAPERVALETFLDRALARKGGGSR